MSYVNSRTFPFEDRLPDCYKRKFRVVPAHEFLKRFASDRRHMKDSKGGWTKPPPSYDCIATEETSNNIDDFISMDPDRGWGTVLDLSQFVNLFTS